MGKNNYIAQTWGTNTVVCSSEHTQAKDDVFVMWSPWLFLIGQEEEAALSSPSALSCSQTGWSSASSAHAQYVLVYSCVYIYHTSAEGFSIRADILSLCVCQWRASTRRFSRTLRTDAALFTLPLRGVCWRSVTCSYRWALHSQPLLKWQNKHKNQSQ